MKLTSINNIYIPDGSNIDTAFERVTHLAIGAHADDVEIFGFHGILQCFNSKKNGFAGVTVTDGANSPRMGEFKNTTNEEMIEIRRIEQNKAADIGKYALQLQLGLSSAECKSAVNDKLKEQIKEILIKAKPKFIYTHNLADKHDTHVAIAIHTIAAVKDLKSHLDLEGFYGCEVWRSLDWLADEDKVVLPVSEEQKLAEALCAVHKSQISGGKRYDKAAIARRISNATFLESKSVDQVTAAIFAMDYMPLLKNKNISELDLVQSHLEKFTDDTVSRLKKFSP